MTQHTYCPVDWAITEHRPFEGPRSVGSLAAYDHAQKGMRRCGGGHPSFPKYSALDDDKPKMEWRRRQRTGQSVHKGEQGGQI